MNLYNRMPKMGVTLLLSVILLVPLVSAEEELYSLSAPRWLRAHEPYNVMVYLHVAKEPAKITATITRKSSDPVTGRLSENSTEVLSGSVEAKPKEMAKINLQVGDLEEGSYQLTLKGTGGVTFERISGLDVSRKNVSLFIQTDKAIYQPSQTIKFRVVAVDKYLKPIANAPLFIYIQDANSNRIKQWEKASTGKDGIFEEGELKLSEQPVLGDWAILAELQNEKGSASVSVQEYVLPTYEVSVSLPPFATYNQSSVVATVNAKYTFGKPVKGEVAIRVMEEWCTRPYAFCQNTGYNKTVPINGKANIEIPLSDLNLDDARFSYQKTYSFVARVVEELTGRIENGTGTLTFYTNAEKIEYIQSSPTFKPGLPFEILVKLSYRDDRPVSDASEQLICRTDYTESGGLTFKTDSKNFTVPTTGVVSITLDPPIDTDNVRISCSYKGQEAFNYVNKADSLSTRYLLLDVQTKDAKVGDEVNVQIQSTVPLTEIIYLVVGKSNILDQGQIKLESASRNHTLKIKVIEPMVPKGRVICYLVTGCGEVVADAIEFNVGDVFKTPVAISTDVNMTKPGSPVEIIVDTKPDSYVGLRAVDQSVLLLKRGNELTQQDVLNELQNYELGRNIYYPVYFGYFPIRPRSTDATGIFRDSGLLFFTSGLLSKPSSGFHGGFMKGGAGGGMVLADSAEFEIASRVDYSSEAPKLRSFFPETWLWKSTNSGPDGKAKLPAVAPDTITSWVLSAIAMNSESGLGVSPVSANVTVFRPFFIALNLPYSIVRGEVVTLQALVFNYLKDDLDATVTLEKTDDFELADADNEVSGKKDSETKVFKAKSGDGVSVTFRIKPLKVGYIDLKVTANGGQAGDSLVKKLLVKPEGSPQYFNVPVLLDLRSTNKLSQNVEITVPEQAVPGSEYIKVTAISDIMGPIVNNLLGLVRMPYGCGEQNMVNFVPNIVVLDYLTESKQLKDDLKNKAIGYLESGYQRELTYKHNDGSFSAFGKRDNVGSTWLTAFVIRSFIQAKPYVAIDPNVIDSGLSFLARAQSANGSFVENGEVHQKSLQGGSGGGVALAAYVLVAFLLKKEAPLYPEVISNATMFLESQLPSLNDKYDIAITAYALQLANSKFSDEAYNKALGLADKKGSFVFLTKPLPPADKSTPWYSYQQRSSVDVEMSSYLLLSAAARNDTATAISIAQWLLTKRNEFGGYQSTQDTVVGIQGLAAVAKILSPAKTDIAVDFKYGQRSKNIQLNKDNSLVLQEIELPKETRQVEVTGTGEGFGLAQVSWSYYLNSSDKSAAFKLETTIRNKQNDSYIVNVCASYTEEGESNMAVIEVNLPSGYTYEKQPQQNDTLIKREDVKEGNTGVVFYFDKIGEDQICVNVGGQRTFKVDFLRPALVVVYDYYRPEKRAEAFYDITTA